MSAFSAPTPNNGDNPNREIFPGDTHHTPDGRLISWAHFPLLLGLPICHHNNRYLHVTPLGDSYQNPLKNK